MNMGEYAQVIVTFEEILTNLKPRAFNLQGEDLLCKENEGQRFMFKYLSFRSKNVPTEIEAESGKYRFRGDLDKDPHLYCKVGKMKVYLTINPLWITTSTAFGDFKSPEGRTSNLYGLCLLKKVDDAKAICTPLVIGLPDYFGFNDPSVY